MVSDHLAVFLIQEWKKAYGKRPKTTVLVTVVFIALGTLGPILDTRGERARITELRRQNPDFDSQLKQIETTEEQLKAILSFVQSQRDHAEDFQSKVEALRSEQTELEPVVQANRKIVEALFSLQEKRQKTKVWRERWIGFGFGVLASLIATAIWYGIVQILRRRGTHHSPRSSPNDKQEGEPVGSAAG